MKQIAIYSSRFQHSNTENIYLIHVCFIWIEEKLYFVSMLLSVHSISSHPEMDSSDNILPNFKANCSLNVHSVHLKLAVPISG